MTKKLNSGLKAFFLIYFIAVFILNTSDLYGYFFGSWYSPFKAYNQLSLISFIIILTVFLTFIMSIVLITIVYFKNLAPKLFLLPVLTLVQYTYAIFMPVMLILGVKGDKAIATIEALAHYDFIFYIISIFGSIYMAYFIIKNKK